MRGVRIIQQGKPLRSLKLRKFWYYLIIKNWLSACRYFGLVLSDAKLASIWLGYIGYLRSKARILTLLDIHLLRPYTWDRSRPETFKQTYSYDTFSWTFWREHSAADGHGLFDRSSPFGPQRIQQRPPARNDGPPQRITGLNSLPELIFIFKDFRLFLPILSNLMYP